jgi:hypothetical protein
MSSRVDGSGQMSSLRSTRGPHELKRDHGWTCEWASSVVTLTVIYIAQINALSSAHNSDTPAGF